ERLGADRHRDRHRHRAPDRRRGGDRERVRDPGPRAPHHRRDPAPRLSGDPGRGGAVQLRLRAGQSDDRPPLHRARSEDPLLSVEALTRFPVPDGIAVAPPLPDVLPPVKLRRGFAGLMRRHPTVTIGGALLILLILMALLAPFLATVDPTALAPARRTRAPSPPRWSGLPSDLSPYFCAGPTASSCG